MISEAAVDYNAYTRGGNEDKLNMLMFFSMWNYIMTECNKSNFATTQAEN